MGITETWLSGTDADNVAIGSLTSILKGYKVISHPRKSRHGGGVAVIVRKTLKTKMNRGPAFKTFEHMDVSLSCGSDTVRLVLIYRPPPSKANRCTANMFMDEFATLLDSLTLAPGRLLLAGDFNFHVNVASSKEASNFLKLLDSQNLHQHVLTPTHIRGHTLDLLITRSEDNLIQAVELVADLPSDHSAVISSLRLKAASPVKKQIQSRSLHKLDIDRFVQSISASQLLTPLDEGSLAMDYNSTLTKILDEHAPMKTRTITERPHSPWYSE